MFSSALWLAMALPAQAACTTFTAADVRRLADVSAAALLRDDATAHRKAWLDLREGFPCLAEQLPADAWMSLLISEAVVANALGEDWLVPLDTASSIQSDLPGLPQFLADQYTAVRRWGPLPRAAVVPGGTLFVDGTMVTAPPKLTGIHLVQLFHNGRWINAWLTGDEGIPASWLASTVPVAAPAPRTPGRGDANLAAGVGGQLQFVSDPGTWFGNARQSGFQFGLTSAGAQGLPSGHGFCIAWDVRAAMQTPSVVITAAGEQGYAPGPLAFPDAYASLGYIRPGFAITGGGGITRAQVTAGDVATRYWYPQPHLQLDVWGDRADFGLGVGATPSATHLRIRGGGISASQPNVALRFGVDANAVLAFFDETAGSGRSARALGVGLQGTVGASWGFTNRD